MAKSNRKKKQNTSKNHPKTRKDIRKEKRLQKKENKRNFFNKKRTKQNIDEQHDDNKKISLKISSKNGKFETKNDNDLLKLSNSNDSEEIASDFELSDEELNEAFNKIPKQKNKQQESAAKPKILEDRFHENQAREKRQQKELEREMRKRRIEQLKKANEDEDKIIKSLEKKLKIDKHKTNKSSIHKMFSNDGLDQILELCLPENIEKMYTAAKEAAKLDDQANENDFEEDFQMVLNKNQIKNPDDDSKKTKKVLKKELNDKNLKKKQKTLQKIENKYLKSDEDSDSERQSISGSEQSNDFESDSEMIEKSKSDRIIDSDDSDFDILGEEDEELDELHNEEESENNEDSANESDEESNNLEDIEESREDEKLSDDALSENSDNSLNGDNENQEKPDVWEDIYGRKRDKQGNIIEDKSSTQKYVPPHVRSALLSNDNEENDVKRKEKLNNLRRSCKGFLNRLAESNMHKIASEMENLFMKNSRYDMNNTLTKLIFESIVSNILSKERLVLEHAMLIAILHANVGTEVGAHFLQELVKNFDALLKKIVELKVEDKELDNIVFILSHLYTFKVFQHTLMFEIINRLIETLCEKTVECLLLILKSIGFQLRKDDPGALKDLILTIQKRATTAPLEIKENPRLKFMLDILSAIKNNNMNKIPNYDPTLAEHLKKVLKSILINGKYVGTLNITIEDLLSADEKGKWWVVGSAWTGNIKDIGPANKISNKINDNQKQETFSEQLLELAKKQRMNTEDRKNVFCILMSAEDFIDAFERLLHLSLKDHRIIASIVIHCCLSEKLFNPYYSALAQKFCEYDRKYQLAFQFSSWDRIKDIQSMKKFQIQNFAQFLVYLIINGGLPVSVLKVVEFAELEKLTLRLVRQIILGILLSNEEECKQVFERIAPSVKLNTFKDSIRLFMHHFLLNETKKTNRVPHEQMELLKTRVKLVDNILECVGSRVKF